MRATYAARCLSFLLLLAVTSAEAQLLGSGGRDRSARGLRAAHAAYVRGEVDKVLVRFERAFNEGNAEKVASTYAPDATMVTETGAVLTGRESVRDRYEAAMPRVGGCEVRVHSFDTSGDLAYALATLRYEVRLSSGGAAIVQVPVSFMFRMSKGNWLISAQTGGELPGSVTAHGDIPPRPAPGDTVTVRVRVTDVSGQPLPNVLVLFEREAGDLTISDPHVRTDAHGIATTAVTIGADASYHILLARAETVGKEPVVFRFDSQVVEVDWAEDSSSY